MGDYERSTTVAILPVRLFGYLADVQHLPGENPDTSTLTVRLPTERVEGPSVEDGLAEAVAGLRRPVEQAENA